MCTEIILSNEKRLKKMFRFLLNVDVTMEKLT